MNKKFKTFPTASSLCCNTSSYDDFLYVVLVVVVLTGAFPFAFGADDLGSLAASSAGLANKPTLHKMIPTLT